MALMDIDVVRPESFERAVNAVENMFPGKALVVRPVAHGKETLGCNHKVMTGDVAQGLPQHFFGSAGGVDVGRIKKTDPKIISRLDDLAAFRDVDR
jgi:hypothetical protein